MKNILHELFHNSAFIKAGGIATITMGTFLFGGGASITLIEYGIKLLATIITGFSTGFLAVIGKHYANKVIRKKDVKSRRNQKNKEGDKAA